MLEKNLQRYLIDQVKKRGLGIAVKVDCPSRKGWPDLVHVDDTGLIRLVEMKTPRGRLSLHQRELIDELYHKHDCTVHVLASKESIDVYLEWVTNA